MVACDDVELDAKLEHGERKRVLRRQQPREREHHQFVPPRHVGHLTLILHLQLEAIDVNEYIQLLVQPRQRVLQQPVRLALRRCKMLTHTKVTRGMGAASSQKVLKANGIDELLKLILLSPENVGAVASDTEYETRRKGAPTGHKNALSLRVYTPECTASNVRITDTILVPWPLRRLAHARNRLDDYSSSACSRDFGRNRAHP